MKVTVRIHTPHGLEFKTVKVTAKGNIILRKKKGDSPAWKAHLLWYETKHNWFGRTKHFTDIFPDSTNTWTLHYDKHYAIRPELEQEEVGRIAKMKVFEKRYNTEPKTPGATIMYIMFAVMVIGFIALGLIGTGRIRL